jgi:hypothetical protein
MINSISMDAAFAAACQRVLVITEWGAAAACFLATLLAMAALRPVAVVVDLVDKPGGRKTHLGDIPIVGGIAMFMGCTFGVGLLPPNSFVSAPLLSAGALVVLVGLLDDRFELSPYARLGAHLSAALLVLSTSSDLSITTLGTPFGSSPIVFSSFGAAVFTCVAIVGAINAFNMLDGMDGLAGPWPLSPWCHSVLATLAGEVRSHRDPGVRRSRGCLPHLQHARAFQPAISLFMGDRAAPCWASCLLACIGISQGSGRDLADDIALGGCNPAVWCCGPRCGGYGASRRSIRIGGIFITSC